MKHATPFAAICRLLAASMLLSITAVLSACSQQAEGSPAMPARHAVNVELARTSHGVVHVRADDFGALGYGIAYAYAEDNLCMFADSLLTVQGERSRFFGGDAHATQRVGDEYGAASDFIHLRNEDSDFFFKGYLDLAELKAGYAAASQEARDLLAGYAAGYNRFLKDNAGHYPAACNKAAWVRPITAEDLYLVIAEKALHASGEVFAAEIVAGAVDGAVKPEAASGTGSRLADTTFMRQRLDELSSSKLGSNALALGKELTDSGRGILLGNPHYPWTSTDRFYQAHMTVPGRYDAMGVILGGIPLVVIGFNHDVAWTHTVTTAVHFTSFRLKLDPADPTRTTYFMDGKPVKMTSRKVTVDVLQPDGTYASRSKTFYFSKQGAVMVKPDAGMVWSASAVTVLADPNRNNTRLIDQWIGIGSAHSVHELKASLDKIVGLPWVNTIAADRSGDTLYADASVVPRVGADKFKSDCMLVPPLLTFDGSRSECGWGRDGGAPEGIQAPDGGPWMIRSDYVGNSNDSYWLTNARALMAGPAPYGFSPLYGKTGVEQKLRTRVGFSQLQDELAQHRRFKIDDVQRLAFANRVHAAELVLPQLLLACKGQGDAAVQSACKALAVWDRHAELDSRGAVLFREFWNIASKIPNKWGKPFDPTDPVNTPSGVAPTAMPAMFAALKQATKELQGMKVPLNARLGDFQGDIRNGVRVPVHGAIGDIDGSYNSIHMVSQLGAAGYRNVAWGTSYVQAVTFNDDGPVAHAMLVYGQSTDPKSPWYADQVKLFSDKQWPVLPFSREAIKRDAHYAVRILSE
ncbi:N-acyl homoserine lactone acylase QqaR [Massilia terrae]|uniref:Penicillin acylase family protein n=1 Tax=Massilia terrae TaxID=1811224 RepID=A0ABT2D4R6_9BURK|nr:penicillin acylase family protein [Massilia terrae]MCS0661233.1 penicillin acylase family protein [Massilia terrae]